MGLRKVLGIPGHQKGGFGRFGAFQDAIVIRILRNLEAHGGCDADATLPQRRKKLFDLRPSPGKLPRKDFSYLIHDGL